MKKIIFLAFVFTMLFATKSFTQQNIFTYPANFSVDSLNQGQRLIFDKIKRQNRYISIHFIRIFDIKETAKEGKAILTFANNKTDKVILNTLNIQYENENEYSWRGRYINKKNKKRSYVDFTLLKRDGRFIGHIDVEKSSFEIFDLLNGIQVICETNTSLYKNDICGAKQASPTQPTAPPPPVIGPCEDGRSKVLILYNQDAANEPDITGTSYLAVQQLNDIWSYSHVKNSLDIAAILPTTFAQTSSYENDGVTLKNDLSIQNLRNLYKAEIVVLLVGYQYDGIAGYAVELNTSFSNAYAIVCTPTATTSRYTFAHEVTHLFGGYHEDCNCTQRGRIFKTGAGWFGWGGNWRQTLMATTPISNERIPYLSSPKVEFMDVYTGDDTHDVASEVNLNKYRIGAFYPDPVSSQFNFVLSYQPSAYWWPYKTWYGHADVCDKTVAVTYNWYISFDGFNWMLISNLQSPTLAIIKPQRYIKCEILDASNNLIISFQKTFIYYGFWGEAI